MTKQKYAIAYILCFALVLVNILSLFNGLFVNSSNSAHVDAADLWSSYTQKATEDSDGYYIINSPKKLSWFLNSSTVQKAKLVCDIDMSAHYWDSPKVSRNIELNGTGHIISGLKYSADNSFNGYIGLIGGCLDKNICISNATLTMSFVNSGSEKEIYGFGGFVAYSSSGEVNITNCSVYGDISVTCSNDNSYFGGLVGYVSTLYMTNCFNNSNISFSNCNQESVGGLVGYVASFGQFRLCGNYGNITAKSKNLGGLIGKGKGLNLSESKCFNSATITNLRYQLILPQQNTGGIVGYYDSSDCNTISYVYHIGEIKDAEAKLCYKGSIIGNSSNYIRFLNLYTIATFNSSTKSINKTYNSVTGDYVFSNNKDASGKDSYGWYIKVQIEGSVTSSKFTSGCDIFGKISSYSLSNAYIFDQNGNYKNDDKALKARVTLWREMGDNSGVGWSTYTIINNSGYTDILFRNGDRDCCNNVVPNNLYWINSHPEYKEIYKKDLAFLKAISDGCGLSNADWEKQLRYFEFPLFHIYGVRAIWSNNNLKIMPLVYVDSYFNGNEWGYHYLYNYNKYLAIDAAGYQTCSLSSPPTYFTVVTSLSNLKFDKIDNNEIFKSVTNINNGLPIFKEMYWEYAV